MGLQPGRQLAAVAGGAELGGGALTALGLADPLGPVAIAATMVTAVATHAPKGPFSMGGGYELPLTNLAAALVLATVGPGRIRLGGRLSPFMAAAVTLGAAGMTAYTASRVLAQQQQAALQATTDVDLVAAEAELASGEPLIGEG
jgi:putative oxidoreductase